MNSFFIFILVVLAIGLPIMYLYRRYQTKKMEVEMREQAVLQDTIVTSTRNMRSEIPQRKSNLRVVDKPVQPPVDATPDELMFFSAAALSGQTQTPIAQEHTEVRTPNIFKGHGGTHDGGGASGDWDRSSNTDTSSSNDTSSSSSDSSSSSSSSND